MSCLCPYSDWYVHGIYDPYYGTEIKGQRLGTKSVRKKRSLWKVPGRTEQWWLALNSGVSPPEVRKKRFRVTREDFLELDEMIRPYSRERSKRVRQNIITLEKRVAMTLHYLKDQALVVMAANVFGCSISFTCNAVKEVCCILSKNIAPCMIKYPSCKAEVEKANREFLQKFGLPRVLECIDGTHNLSHARILTITFHTRWSIQ